MSLSIGGVLSLADSVLRLPVITQAQIDMERQGCEKRIKDLRLHFLSLCTMRNALCQINRSPAEIVGEVFIAVVQSYVDLEYREPWRYRVSDVVGWLAITEVCRHWHKTALATLRMWSFIPLLDSCYQGTEQLLERSRQTPLSFFQALHPSRHVLHIYKDLTFRNATRLRELVVSFNNRTLGSFYTHSRFNIGLSAHIRYDLYT